ncbi:MAG: TraV family lipoprotein [Thiotrichales bacterium]|nr:TraV family lipoprotein [Thiotrichales bacterium]
MAETSTPQYRPLTVLALTTALAGCAATHVGDDWQCPLAQGEVCTSIVAADPAVAPDAAPPPLATDTPLYRTADPQAMGPEKQPEPTTQPDAKPRPCAKGCHPLAWLGRLFAPRMDAGEAADSDEPESTAPSASGASDQEGKALCGAEASALQPTPAVIHADKGALSPHDDVAPCAIAAEVQDTAPSAPIMAEAPITPSTAPTISCGTDDAPAAPPLEVDGATDGPASDDPETPCATLAPVDEAASAAIGEPDSSMVANTETGGVEVAATGDAMPPPIADAPPPAAATFLLPSPTPDTLRTGEVVGRIWIAPFVDAGGVYREGAWVRAVLAPARWRR